MGNTLPKRGELMDLGLLCARRARPLTEVKSTESRKLDVRNIEAYGKMVKMSWAPYKDPQDLLKFLDALETDMSVLNANLAPGADSVSPVVMTKLIDNLKTVLAIYGEVLPAFDALQRILEAPGIGEHDYWSEKVQVCHWLQGASQTGKGGSSECTGCGRRCKDQEKGMYNAFGLRPLTFPLASRYSSPQIPPYIGLGRRELDEPGLMPLVLYTWLETVMWNRDH